MNKILLLFLSCILLSGCSLIPKINFDTPNTVPQNVQKSKAKEVCKGKAEFDVNGNITFCSKGYYSYDEGYNKEERKMTITERVKSFINSLVGWGFWGLLLLFILVPGLFGTVIGRIVEGTVGLTGKTLKAVVRGVQTARKNGKDLNTALATELDTDDKKLISKIKDKNNIK